VGSGEFATLRFRVKAAGDAKFGFAKVEARDMQNHTIMPQHSVAAVAPKVFATAFAPAMPNPFNQRTTFRFSLSKPGRADLQVFAWTAAWCARCRTVCVRRASSRSSGTVPMTGPPAQRRRMLRPTVTPQLKQTRVVTFLK
jgi:hypothetical protein